MVLEIAITGRRPNGRKEDKDHPCGSPYVPTETNSASGFQSSKRFDCVVAATSFHSTREPAKSAILFFIQPDP